MKTRRQQELDLEALEDEFSSDTTSSLEDKSSLDSSEDLVEIMGFTLDNSNKEGLQDNLGTSYSKPVVKESKLQ